jgi:hypothetical protein
MMEPSVHPSFLELDRLAVNAAQPATRDHVAGCAQCQAHLGRLQHEVHVPQWVRGGTPAPSAPPRWRWLAVATAVACASVVAGVTATLTRSGATSGEKAAAPGVAVFIKRDERVARWDTREPVAPGDSLRLQIAAPGYSHVRVSSGSEVLFDAELTPAATELLPISWRVDDSPGDETLDVTLSGAGLPEWTRVLVLKKEGH